MHTLGSNLRDEIKENTREIISHFNASQGAQNVWIKDRFDRVDANVETLAEDVAKIKLAVVDLMATDRHMHNLVRELKSKNIAIDEQRVFSS